MFASAEATAARPAGGRDRRRAVGHKPIRIGLMMRGIDEYDGAGVYIRKLVDALLELDRVNHYVLFYANGTRRPAAMPTIPTCARWWCVHLASCCGIRWRCPSPRGGVRLDVLFHHKFSIPVDCTLPDGGAAARHRVLDASRSTTRRGETG